METFFLHILRDEKVVNSFISLMEETFPNESTYLIIQRKGYPKRVAERKNVVFFDKESKELRRFLKSISGYKHVCIHCMGVWKFYQKIHHSSMSWVIWGGDLYGKLLRFKGYELFYDKQQQYKVRAGKMPVWLYRTLETIRDFIWASREERIVNRLRYVITDNGCDYEVFQHYFGDKKIQFAGTINYYPIENLIDPAKKDEECSGKTIWVNNSADAQGNHTWVFDKLKHFSNDVKVMTPISYGDARFMRFIDAEGRRILGDRFISLKDFLPVNEYYDKFLQANAFVFGHYRQCAVGNIIMALYFGGKVFLSVRNPLLKMYKENGFVIFSIEDDLNEAFAMQPLSAEVRQNNRKLVMSIASHESSINQLNNVFGKIKASQPS